MNHWLATASSVLAGVEALGLQRVRDIAGDAHRGLAAGVGMAAAVVHGSQGWRQVAGISTMVLATESQQCVLLAAVPAQSESLVIKDAWILRPVHHKHSALGVLLGCAAGCLAVCLEGSGHQIGRHAVVACWDSPILRVARSECVGDLQATIKVEVGAKAATAAGSVAERACHAERLAFDVQPHAFGGQRCGMTDIVSEAVAAICWYASQNLNRWSFIALAVRAAVLPEI